MIKWLEKNRKVSWVITIFIFGVIFYLSSLSFSPSVAGPQSINAILYHLSIFFLLAFSLLVSVLSRRWEFKKISVGLLTVTTYAALDELHQFFVPGRFCSIDDFLLDFTGILFAFTIYFVLIAKNNYYFYNKKH
jgi:VanZ family protein